MTTRFRYGSGKLIEDVYKDDLELRLREQSHSVSRGFLPLIKRRRRRCLNSLLLRSGNFAGYIEVLFHTLYYGVENIVRYTEDFVISSFVISRFHGHCTKQNEK